MADQTITRTCLICGNPLKPRCPKTTKYCSRPCQYEAHRGPQIPIEKRFYDKVNKTQGQGPHGDCWEWTGKCKRDGYGVIWNTEKQSMEERAHRVSYRIHYGNIPEGMFICHKCDNRKCVRPDHLFLGTMRDNMDDMTQKHRSTHGARNPRAKFSEDVVRAIRRFPPNITDREIGAQFNMSRRNVGDIRRYRIWKYID